MLASHGFAVKQCQLSVLDSHGQMHLCADVESNQQAIMANFL